MAIAARLLWRTSRFEVALAAAAPIVLAIAAIFIASQLQALAPSASCFGLLASGYGPDDLARCPTLAEFQALRGGLANMVSFGLAGAPSLAGVLIGSQLVSREIEHRTAVLAWSVEPSRRHWLAERIATPAALTTFVGIVSAVASGILVAALHPGVDIGASFDGYGLWGPLVLVRAIAALAAGVAVGAIVGRVVPAILLTGFATLAIALGSTVAAPLGYPTQIVPEVGNAPPEPGARYVDWVVVAPDGRRLTFDEARAGAPAELDAGEATEWVYANHVPSVVVIPGREMASVAVREGLLLAITGAACLVISAVTVARRRPY